MIIVSHKLSSLTICDKIYEIDEGNLKTGYNRKIKLINLLIIKGTGSFGKAFVKKILYKYKIKRLVVFSRDEFKQYEMSKHFPNF